MKPRFARRLVQFRNKSWVVVCEMNGKKAGDWLPVTYCNKESDDIKTHPVGSWDLSRFELRYDLGYKNKRRAK